MNLWNEKIYLLNYTVISYSDFYCKICTLTKIVSHKVQVEKFV